MLSYFQETGKIHVTLKTKKNGFRRFLLPDVSHATQKLLNSQAALLEQGATSYSSVPNRRVGQNKCVAGKILKKWSTCRPK